MNKFSNKKIQFFIIIFFLSSSIFNLKILNDSIRQSCESNCFNPYFKEGPLSVDSLNKYYKTNYKSNFFEISGTHTHGDLALPYFHADNRDPYGGPLLDFPYRSNLFPFGNLIMLIFSFFTYKTVFFIYLILSFSLFFYSNYLWLKNLSNSLIYTSILTFGSYPFLFAIDRGNLESLVAPLISIGVFILQNKNKDIFGTLVLILGFSVKGIHIIFLYMLFFYKRFKLLFLSITAFLTINLISLISFKSSIIDSIVNYYEAASRLTVFKYTEYNTSLNVLNDYLLVWLGSRLDTSLGNIYEQIRNYIELISNNFFTVSILFSAYVGLLIYFKFQDYAFKFTLSFLTISILYVNLFTSLNGVYRLIFIQICLCAYFYEIDLNERSSKLLDLYFSISIISLFPYRLFDINLHPTSVYSTVCFVLFVILIHFPNRFFEKYYE